MARLPIPGGDREAWGTILNDFLSISHNPDGSLKSNAVTSDNISDGSIAPAALDSSNGASAGQVLSYNAGSFEWITPNAAGVSDHGALVGLADDDHLQYHTDARGDTRYYTQSQIDTALNAKAATTHGHVAANITDFTEATQDVIGTSLVAGSNVTVTYDDAVGSATISATPGAGVTDLSSSRTATTLTVISSTGLDAILPAADATNAGILTAADKTKLDGIAAGAEVNTVDSVAGKTGAVILVKADVGLSNVDNTSDAAKPVSTATQTALDAKANTTHAHVIADTTNLQTTLDGKASTVHSHTQAQSHNSADTDTAPTALHHTLGAGANQAATGNHGHTGYLATAGSNVATLPNSATQFIRVDIPDDASPTSGWPDRYVNFFNGTRTGYFNEYGEVRARPAKTNTVAIRAMAHASGTTGDIFQVAHNSSGGQVYLGVGQSTASLTVPMTSTSSITATNIGSSRVFASPSASEPAGPRSVGDVWVKY